MAWCWWGYAPRHRSWWRWPMGSGSSATRGRSAGCHRRGDARPSSHSWASGARAVRGRLREVFPGDQEQRCWVHKAANVLAALLEDCPRGASRKALNEIAQSVIPPTPSGPSRRSPPITAPSGPGIAKVVDDTEALCAEAHPIRPSIGSISGPRIRSIPPSRRCCQNPGHQGPGKQDAGLAMVFRVAGEAAERQRGRYGPHLVALVRAVCGSRRVGWSDDPRRRQRRRPTRSPRDHARLAIHRRLTIPRLGGPGGRGADVPQYAWGAGVPHYGACARGAVGGRSKPA